jgi:hypothetical protein
MRRHDEDRRRAALTDLIQVNGPVADCAATVRSFPWDHDEDLYTIGRPDARAALAKFTAGEISADELLQWAEAIECREDVGFTDDLVSKLIFALATPEINEPISPESIAAWQTRLDLPR